MSHSVVSHLPAFHPPSVSSKQQLEKLLYEIVNILGLYSKPCEISLDNFCVSLMPIPKNGIWESPQVYINTSSPFISLRGLC